ncbi:hypothetical protein Tco_1507259 [Tanacetum coccineum]
MPPEDEVFPVEEQPLLDAVSPTANSPGYIADSDPKEDEEDPIVYPADGGDDDVDESSDDDEDYDVDVEEDEDEGEEEEEHPALADSVPSPVRCVTARMSIQDELPTPFWSEAEIAKLLAIPSPPLSPLSLWSSPPPQIPSLPLPLRAETPSTSYPLPLSTPPSRTPPLLPIPLPTPSPPLLLPSTNCRAGVFKVTSPPRKRLCIALGLRYEVGESSSAPTARPTRGFRADYGFVATLDDEIRRDLERDGCYVITDTWDEMFVGMPGAPATDETELGRRLTYFVTTVRQDTDEIYERLDDAQDDKSLMSDRLNMLFRDRRAHAHTALLMEREAKLSREAWGRSMDASDTARSKVRALRTTLLVQQIEIAALRAADHARQVHLMETLRLMSTIQTKVTELQGKQGPAKGPAQPEIPEEAGSHVCFQGSYTGLERLQDKLEDNEMIAAEVQRIERENFIEEQKAKFLVETIAAQRRFRAEQQAALRRSKPPTILQLRNQMMKYIRNVSGKANRNHKNKSYEEIRDIYEKVKRFNDEFVAIGSTKDEQAIKEMNIKAEEPSKKRKAEKLNALVKKTKVYTSLTYIAVNKEGNLLSNVGKSDVNEVAWEYS